MVNLATLSYGSVQYVNTLLLSDAQQTASGLLTADQFAYYVVTAILTIINFLVAYFILRRFVFKPVIRLFNKRKEMIEHDLSEAESNKHAAIKNREEADHYISEARSEADDIIVAAKEQAHQQAQKIVAEAKEKEKRLLEKAKAENLLMRQRMLEQMREDIADLAIAIATQAVKETLDDELKNKLERSIMDRIHEVEVKADE